MARIYETAKRKMNETINNLCDLQRHSGMETKKRCEPNSKHFQWISNLLKYVNKFFH